jgi:tRNA threonylcarbamoyl adenosine modification protein YeaZ
MIIFAFDTTSEYGGAGILRGRECLASVTTAEYATASERISGHLDYSVVLFQMTDRLLRETGLKFDDIELFAVANGPGSFTGIRVGVAAAQAWGQVFERPVFGVPVLEAMADESRSETDWAVPIMDARRGEFFVAALRSSRQRGAIEPRTHDSGSEGRNPRGELQDAARELGPGGSRMPLPDPNLPFPAFGFQSRGLNFQEAFILNPDSVREFVSALKASGDVTCIAREHDSHAKALRSGLVCGGAILRGESPAAGDEVCSLPEQEALDRSVRLPLRWHTVRESLVHAIGRLALRASQEGRLLAPAELDAFYIRRPDAEIRRQDD